MPGPIVLKFQVIFAGPLAPFGENMNRSIKLNILFMSNDQVVIFTLIPFKKTFLEEVVFTNHTHLITQEFKRTLITRGASQYYFKNVAMPPIHL